MRPVRRKKTVPKKVQPSPKRSHRIARAEANEMFAYFQKVRGGGGLTEVARQFGRARNSIIKLSVREKWEERAEEILNKVRKAVDKGIEKQEISNLELVRTIKKAAVHKVLESLKDKTLDVGVREALAAITTEEELMEKLPEGSKPMEHNPAEIQEAVELIGNMDAKMLGKLGDLIGSGKIPLDQLMEEFLRRQNG